MRIEQLGRSSLSVEQRLREILVPWVKDEALTLDITSKIEDLAIDSLDLVEVMFEIEERFDVSLAQTHQEAKTARLADVVGWIEQQLALKRNGTAELEPARQELAPAR
jgi:acyl carrier protein